MADGLDPDDGGQSAPKAMNEYTAMLLLSFLALSVGCLLLAYNFYSSSLPPSP